MGVGVYVYVCIYNCIYLFGYYNIDVDEIIKLVFRYFIKCDYFIYFIPYYNNIMWFNNTK